jgi:hypothetical protein
MSNHVSADELHDRAWELLPWIVNGRLVREEEPWIARHLDECAACRREIEVQSDIRSALVGEARVEYTPQASFQKLVARMEEIDHASPHDPISSGPAAVSAVLRRKPAVAPASRLPRWLVYTLAVQCAAVTAIAIFVGWGATERFLAPNYQTLSAREPAAPAGGNLHVVLAPTVTVTEFQSLLELMHAQVLAGPSAAHVWTLVVPYAADSAEFAALIRNLRSNPRIAFVEPVAAEAKP